MFVWAGGRRENIVFSGPNKCELSAAKAKPFDEVWFADLCPRDLADPAAGLPFMVFDHHVSNARLHANHRCTVFDMKRSGTSLMAQQLGLLDNLEGPDPESFMRLISALEAYDLGRFDDLDGMRLADLAATFSQEVLLDAMIGMDPAQILHDSEWTSRADAMSAVRRLYAASAAKSAQFTTVWSPSDNRHVVTACASSPVYWKNDVSLSLLDLRNKAGEAVELAVIFDATGGMVSLRSGPNGPDCSMIAGGYGGGGHARAAGIPVKFGSMLEALTDRIFG